MSCIIGTKLKDCCIIVSDSRCSGDETYFTQVNGIDGKNTRYYQDKLAIMAHCGRASDMALIKQIPHLFDDFDEDYPEFNYEYVQDVFIPKVRQDYCDAKLLDNKLTHKFPTVLTIAKGNKMFSITVDGGIYEIESFDSNGSGSPAAQGAMIASNDKDPLIKALKGIRAAIKYDVGCGYPVIITNTKNTKTHILSKKAVDAIINHEMEFNI